MLGYDLIKKVIGPRGYTGELAATYAEFARFLGESGAIDDSLAAGLADEANQAADAIPRAERLGSALHDLTREGVGERPAVDPDEIVEGSLQIERIETGRIWFEGGIGPFQIPEDVSSESEIGWEVWIAAVPADGNWRLIECGVVYP